MTSPTEINKIYREVLDQRHNQYKLKDGDTLVIDLYSPKHEDLNQTEVIVLPDGKSDLFFMDNFKLSGKTVPEVEAELRARVASQVIEPEISIQVKPKDEKVYMVGEFERLPPMASIDLSTKMTLHEAISAVGGMRVTGDTDWALLRRPFMNPQHPDLFRIDLNDESEEIFLLPGDQVVLGRTWLATVVKYFQEYIFGIFGASPAYYGVSAYSMLAL